MIVLFHHSPPTAIMTPPKCATHTLHDALCAPPHCGQSVVGPVAGNQDLLDRHVRSWPNEVVGFRRVVVVRHPLDRLVSLYLHLARWDAAFGRATPAFWFFAQQVGRRELSDPFYAWSVSQWLAGVEFEAVLRVESLASGLSNLGLGVDRLPLRNASYHVRPWRQFYDPSLLEAVSGWAKPDCDRFGYEWPHS